MTNSASILASSAACFSLATRSRVAFLWYKTPKMMHPAQYYAIINAKKVHSSPSNTSPPEKNPGVKSPTSHRQPDPLTKFVLTGKCEKLLHLGTECIPTEAARRAAPPIAIPAIAPADNEAPPPLDPEEGSGFASVLVNSSRLGAGPYMNAKQSGPSLMPVANVFFSTSGFMTSIHTQVKVQASGVEPLGQQAHPWLSLL